MFWLCSCGDKFLESGMRDGYSEAIKHTWKGRKGEIEGTHKIKGLYQADGEQLVAGQNIRKAIMEGYIEPKEKEKEDGGDRSGLRTFFKIKAKQIEIEIDPEILVLYYLTKEKFKTYNASIGEWISDCLVDYYNEHRELGLDILLSNRPEIIENYILRDGVESGES